MSRPIIVAICGAVLLSACGGKPLPDVARLSENSGNITLPDPDTGTCQANDVTPAVIETVTEQVMLHPASLSADGSIYSPAIYKTETRQVIVKERRELSFEALCESELTPDFIANLQRALAARGFYNGPDSGEMNWRTRRGIRLYQLDQDIDSAILSKETARRLGLVAYEASAFN